MKWYIPSFNGDLRLFPDEQDKQKTVMLIEKPTPDEQRIANEIGAAVLERGWIEKWETFSPGDGDGPTAWRFSINAPVSDLGPLVATIMRPGAATMTAIKITDGIYSSVSGSEEAIKKALEEAKEAAPKKEPKAAATVKRPTPCCPQCIKGAVLPATEVLLTFLDHDQHESWAKERTLVVEGGSTGNHYLLAHRHSPAARRIGRICYDLDDRCVVHFHDLTVPPEEEVLAAKLILEHNEPWLRNEATMLGIAALRATVYKNPFGDDMDGAYDSRFISNIGRAFGLR